MNTKRKLQLIYLSSNKQLLGLGLVEMLFVVTIIIILIFASILYWQSVQRANLVTAGYELVQDIIEVAQGWRPSYIDQGKYAGISTNALIREGGITQEYIISSDQGDATLTTPWQSGSDVQVSQDSSSAGVSLKIIFSLIPNYACVNLANRINGENALTHDDTGANRAECNLGSHSNSSTLNIWYSPDF